MAATKAQVHTVVDSDGAVILDIRRGLISTLNPTGSYVWQGLIRGEAAESIAANLARETDEPMEKVEGEVRGFIEDLRKQGLLQQ